jgi:hypothetical protein
MMHPVEWLIITTDGTPTGGHHHHLRSTPPCRRA